MQQSTYKWIYLFEYITGGGGENIEWDWFNAKVNLIPSKLCSPKSFIGYNIRLISKGNLYAPFISCWYKIIERTDEDGEIYTVPVKVGSKIIPDKHDTLRRVFDREIQKTLLKWLIKINKE